MPTPPRKPVGDRTGRPAAADGSALAFSPDPHGLLAPIGVQSGAPASHRFRVQRGRDLVNLQVSAYGCELVQVEGRPVLRATGPKARLEVRLPFQHIGEESFTSGQPDLPARARAAGGSRLVFRVPEHEAIEYSVEGFLAGLRRLPLIVVPAAQPRLPPPGRLQGVVVAVLPGGFALLRGTQGLVLTTLTKKQAAAHSTRSRSGSAAAVEASVELRLARQVLARESAVDLTNGKVPDLAHLLVLPAVAKKIRRRPRAPRSDETALEAPYRLVLSPSTAGGFTHADAPVDAFGRVELWHSRLGVRVERSSTTEGGIPSVTVDELSAVQRVVRAVWARDLEAEDPPTTHENVPFRMPLDGRDRTVLVTQTSDPESLTPLVPVDAHKLYVSSLGAYLNLSGYWPQDPKTKVTPEILSWDHIAPMGRDQFVKVVYPGYLFPFGHTAALVKQTTRQLSKGTPAVAFLHTEFFLVVTQPVLSYDGRDMPFRQIRVRPLVSPGILDPNVPANKSEVPRAGQEGYGQLLFWPKLVNGQDLGFVLECLDGDGRTSRLTTPLLFVGQRIGERPLDGTPPPPPPSKDEPKLVVIFPDKAHVQDAWDVRPAIDAQAQSIAFAASAIPGQTSMQTAALTFTGTPADPPTLSSTPRMVRASVVVPAIQQLGPPGAATTTSVVYPTAFLDHGFGAGNDVLEQFLRVEGPLEVDFTTGSDRGGGFLAPNLGVHALTRLQGAVGEVTGYTATGLDPQVAFADLLPKLFGIFSLTELLGKDLPVPSFVGAALDEISALLADLEALESAVGDAVTRLTADAATAATQGLRDAAQAALTTMSGTLSPLQAAATAFAGVLPGLQDLAEAADPAAVTAALTDTPAKLRKAVEDIQQAIDGAALPTATRAAVERPLATLLPLLVDAEELVRSISAVVSGVRSLTKAGLDSRASYTWSTPLTNFPKGPADGALFVAEQPGKERSTLSMAVTAGPSGADVTAELTDFALNLFPGAPLIRLVFDRLAFRAAAGKKADVDVVFDGIEFQGVLGFVNTLKDLVPFDGFSDPPYLDVDASGLQAGFDLALPAVAVGVFALENISLHAGLDLPFLGEALTVGFSFCTREKPFRLTVMMIGGGGFVGLTLSPKGLVVLEMSLEAGACLSLNLGVASGSVSVMVGVYLRLEGEEGSLTGYFRIRGEVDVLGLISASITLELSLTYHFASGKLIGRASVEIEVEVFLVSFSVSVSCERKLAGSNGDPTYAQVLSIDAATGTAPEWDAYCAAFAAD